MKGRSIKEAFPEEEAPRRRKVTRGDTEAEGALHGQPGGRAGALRDLAWLSPGVWKAEQVRRWGRHWTHPWGLREVEEFGLDFVDQGWPYMA